MSRIKVFALALTLGLICLAPIAVPPVHAADAATVVTVPKKDVGMHTTCAVCGMKVHVKAKTAAVEYGGKDYFFCSKEDRDVFMQDPAKYAAKAQGVPAPQ